MWIISTSDYVVDIWEIGGWSLILISIAYPFFQDDFWGFFFRFHQTQCPNEETCSTVKLSNLEFHLNQSANISALLRCPIFHTALSFFDFQSGFCPRHSIITALMKFHLTLMKPKAKIYWSMSRLPHFITYIWIWSLKVSHYYRHHSLLPGYCMSYFVQTSSSKKLRSYHV